MVEDGLREKQEPRGVGEEVSGEGSEPAGRQG